MSVEALEIAGRLGDLRLRIITTSFLEQAPYFRGEYERVVELATANLAALPAEWVYENLVGTAPVSVYDRVWLASSLTQLGRFDDAARYAAESIQLAEATQHANTIGAVEANQSQPGFAAHALHLLGDIATHPDRFDAERGEDQYHKALTLAEPPGMRPLIAHCHLGLGKLHRQTGRQQEAQERLRTATKMYRQMDMLFWLEKAEAEMSLAPSAREVSAGAA